MKLDSYIQSRGIQTSAKTHKGLLKAILAHGFAKNKRLEAMENFAVWQNGPSKSDYKTSESQRRGNPEAKRAKNDKTFRRNWIARLNREIDKMNKPALTALEIHEAAKNRSRNKIRFNQIKAQFAIAGVNTKKELLPTIGPAMILSGFSEKKAKSEMGLTPNRQWTISGGYFDIVIADTDSESRYDRGKWKTVTNADHRAQYTSFACVENNDLVTMIGKEIKKIKAPENCRFSIECGIILWNGEMDYHPTEKEIIRGDIDSMLANMEKNREARIEFKKLERLAQQEEEFFKKDLNTTRVTLFDSRKAGNCVEGSLNFAERRLGIPRQDIINGGFLFKVPAKRLVDSGDRLAYNAAKTAWRRETTVTI